MADDKQGQETTGQAFTAEQQAIVTELTRKAVEEATISLHQNIAGLNRKNSELARDVEAEREKLMDMAKSKMTEEEQHKFEIDKKKFELEQWQKKLEEKDQEIILAKNRESAIKYATENKIPLDLVDLVPMDDPLKMMERLEKVKTVVDGERKAIEAEMKKNGGVKPGTGGAGGSIGKKKKSEMTISEAMNFVREFGQEKYDALPE